VGNKKINDLLEWIDEGFDDTRACMREIIQLLEQDGLCYRMSIPPELVGIHPATRAAHDVSPEAVHWIGADLVTHVATWPEDAYAVEDDPDEQIRNFNVQITSSSDGMATLLNVKYGSIAGGLVNHFLCCVNAAVPCGIERLSVDGRMCKEKIIGHRERLNDFLRTGLEWTIFRWAVPIIYPTFIEHAVRRLNVLGGLNRRPHEFAVMSRFLWCATRACEDNNGIVRWDRVRAHVNHRDTMVSRETVDAILVFVKKWGRMVQTICKFHSTFIAGDRRVPVDTYIALNEVNESAPHLVAAIVMAQAGCPAQYVGALATGGAAHAHVLARRVDNTTVCRYISCTAIRNLFKNKSVVTAAESSLKRCNDIRGRSSASEHTQWVAYGRLCVSIVKHILQKKQTPPARTTLEGVCHDFVEELHALENPFVGEGTRAANADEAAPNSTTDDIVVQAVEKSGFTVGSLIKLKHANDGRVWAVDSVDTDGQLLLFAADSCGEQNASITMRVSPKDLPQWQVGVTPGELTGSVGAHIDFRKLEVGKTHIVLAMQRTLDEHPEPPTRIETTHRTAVYAKTSYPKGELCLVYATGVIRPVLAANVDELTEVGRRCRLVPPPMLGIEYMLHPYSMESRNCAAWRVSTVSTQGEANMTIDHRECHVTTQVTDEGSHTCSMRIIPIPVLVNSMRAIQSGEELLVFKEQPSIDTRKRPAELDAATCLAKRAKQYVWGRFCKDAVCAIR